MLKKVKTDKKMITIQWYCSCYVGIPRWQNSEIYEPDECNTIFETKDFLENWDREFCSANCPNCTAELTQSYDDPEILI